MQSNSSHFYMNLFKSYRHRNTCIFLSICHSYRMFNIWRHLFWTFAVLCTPHTTFAETEARYLLGNIPTGSQQPAKAVGQYARGCLAGGAELPETGETWQAMRLSRVRNWAHPNTIDYIKRITKKVAQKTDWPGLYIGDMSQPRGGPMISGHASHQTGLDVDIWMLKPKSLNLTIAQRENLSSISVRAKDQRDINGNWTKSHMEVLKIAASDPVVARIFVTPPAKIWMCDNATGDRKWLRKIRPWWGHHYHFHVRLNCPKNDPHCEEQHLIPTGTGCNADLQWWITTALEPPPPKDPNAKPKPKKKHPRQFVMADLPQQCQNVLQSQ